MKNCIGSLMSKFPRQWEYLQVALIGHGRSSVGTAKAISKSAAAWMGCKRQKCYISGKPASWQVALVPGALTVVMESTAMGHLPARASLWIRPTKGVYHVGLHCETEQLNSVFFVFFGWGSNRMSLSYVGHCLLFVVGGVSQPTWANASSPPGYCGARVTHRDFQWARNTGRGVQTR